MPDPKEIGSKPRPLPLPRLQRAIGNQAVDRLINPPPAPVIESTEDEPPLEPQPQQPPAPGRSWLRWLLPLAGLALGGGLGYLLELTPVAPYAGPALGAALGLVVLASRAARHPES